MLFVISILYYFLTINADLCDPYVNFLYAVHEEITVGDRTGISASFSLYKSRRGKHAKYRKTSYKKRNVAFIRVLKIGHKKNFSCFIPSDNTKFYCKIISHFPYALRGPPTYNYL